MNRKAKQKEGRRTIGRRTLLLRSGMLLVTSFLSGRLYQLQVAQSNRYKRLSDRIAHPHPPSAIAAEPRKLCCFQMQQLAWCSDGICAGRAKYPSFYP